MNYSKLDTDTDCCLTLIDDFHNEIQIDVHKTMLVNIAFFRNLFSCSIENNKYLTLHIIRAPIMRDIIMNLYDDSNQNKTVEEILYYILVFDFLGEDSKFGYFFDKINIDHKFNSNEISLLFTTIETTGFNNLHVCKILYTT